MSSESMEPTGEVVRKISKDGQPTVHHGTKKSTLAPDIQGIFPFIGRFNHGNTEFTVFDSLST